MSEIQAKEYGIEKIEAVKIEKAFTPLIAERDEIAKIYVELIKQEPTGETCASAKRLRNKLVKVRTGIAGVHKTHKAYFLAAGKFVDAWKNKETKPITEMEERLKEMSDYFENKEKERLNMVNLKRKSELRKYVDEEIWMNLSEMEDDVWDAYLSTKKRDHDERIAAEKKAEADRIAQEKKEREERIAKEKEQAEERKRIQAENKKLQAEAEALRVKEAAERKAIDEKARLMEAELSKGDEAKITDLVNDIKAIQGKYTFKSAKYKRLYKAICTLLDKVINHINQK